MAPILHNLDLSQSESIEASIRHFARNKTWPIMEANEAACIYLRLDFAARALLFCAGISVGGQPANLPTEPDALEEEEIYEWILIKIWNDFGRQQTCSAFRATLHLLGFERPD